MHACRSTLEDPTAQNYLSENPGTPLEYQLQDVTGALREFQLQVEHASPYGSAAQCREVFIRHTLDVFKNVSRTELIQILRNPSVTEENVLYKIREKACKGGLFKTLVPPKVMRWFPPNGRPADKTGAKAAIDAHLDRGKPLGLGYNPRAIGKPQYRDDFDGRHASSIVGRRPGANGKCEYLIRNSWGPGCKKYRFPCEKGNIWVPEGELLKSTLTLQWLTD